ncbi:MAG: TatD family hydrolase, partial [Candidatus Andersenbacteria bacterium]
MAMFDSHAHINDEAFDADRDVVIQQCFDAGITGWIEVGTSLEESKKAVALAKKYSQIYASVGVHPHEIQHLTDSSWVELELLVDDEKVKAIGEVGLDFSRIGGKGELASQETVLRRFIALAQEKHLPIIYHVRSGKEHDAHTELLRILKSYPGAERPNGVIHTFSGTLAQAQEYIDLGMMISFSGVITFKNAGELPDIAKTIPLESMLVETDCPYLTLEPFRGKRNNPSYVKFIIQKISEL